MSEYPQGPFDKLRRRQFDDPDVAKVVSGMSVSALTEELGEPFYLRHHTPPRGSWLPGMERPGLASDDPAVTDAMGRCVVYRMQAKVGLSFGSDMHDERRCAWCDYPLDALLAACDHATWLAQYVESELLIWFQDQEKRKGQKLVRPGTASGYQHPAWRDFWNLSAHDRQRRIRLSQYPEVPA